jgi:hypothetical protein
MLQENKGPGLKAPLFLRLFQGPEQAAERDGLLGENW